MPLQGCIRLLHFLFGNFKPVFEHLTGGPATPTNRMERQSGLLIHPCNGARSYSSASHLNHLVTIALCSKIMYTPCSISAWEKRREEGERIWSRWRYTTFRRIKMRAAAITRKKGQTEASASFPPLHMKCNCSTIYQTTLQGGPSGRGQPFVDIAIRVAV